MPDHNTDQLIAVDVFHPAPELLALCGLVGFDAS